MGHILWNMALDNPANVPQPSDARSVLSPHVPRNRSRVSNRREILAGVDQRLAIARRYRDLVAAIAQDQGGADRCSEARMQLIRRFASCAVMAEALEARLASGEEVDIVEHAMLSVDFRQAWSANRHQQGGRDVSPA